MGETTELLEQQLILLAGRGDAPSVYYTHAEFVGAFQAALLARLERMVAPGTPARATLRIVASMRSTGTHHLVLVDALNALRASGHPVEDIQGRQVVAVFPAPAPA